MPIFKRKRKQKDKKEDSIEDIPIAVVPVNPTPLNGDTSKPVIQLNEEELKADMHIFFSRGAPRVADDISWMLAFQYAYFQTDEEGKEVRDRIMTDAREITREFLPLVDKYAIGPKMNALLYALAYLQGTVYGTNYSSEDLQRYIECGQLMKKAQDETPNKAFSRKDLGYG